MTDLHSHIIYDIDDGSRCIKESIDLLKKMKKVGFDNIILTPHYIDGEIYNADNKTKLNKLNVLKEVSRRNKININLYLGNEIFISDSIIDDINSNKCYPLNNSRYLLFEMPFNNRIIYLDKWLEKVKLNGYIPVLAHPERYTFFQRNYKLVDEIKKEGVLFQVNYGSVIGQYGSDAEKLATYLFKKKYVDYLGTDIHRIDNTFVIDNFDKIEKKIVKIVGYDYYQEIIKNGDNIVK